MPRKKKYYIGNYPGSANYDPNLPIGPNKWDHLEAMGDDEDYDEEPDSDDEQTQSSIPINP